MVLAKKDDKQNRANYNLLISQKENQMDELKEEKRKIDDAIHRLDEDLRRGFQALSDLNDGPARFENSQNTWLQRSNEEQEQRFRQSLLASSEQITTAYRNKAKEMAEEREALYKKRSEVTWD